MGRFDGKVAVVTGAGGEIGRVIAMRLARDGARVLAVDIDQGRLEATVAAVGEAGGMAQAHLADVGDGAQVAGYADAAAELGGGTIHLFANNAGVEGPVAPIPDYADEDFDRVIAVNVRGVFLGLKHVLPRMERGGAVVNTASTAGLMGAAGLVGYIASKHAVIGITRTAALECAGRGIRVNAVCPGPVEGRMMTSLEAGMGGAEAHEAFLASLPLGRFARLEEVASMVAFLLADESGFSTGGRFVLDGGQTVG
jgi:3alpha(or 20beta)-hydroxysteroid dehydrogenase